MTFQNEVYTDHEGFGIYEGGDHASSDSLAMKASLYHWVFHFNEYTGTWYAIPRDAYNNYWSDKNHPDIISSSSIQTLIELIQRTDGDKKKIEKLISGQ